MPAKNCIRFSGLVPLPETAGERWGREILPKRRRRDPVSAAPGDPHGWPQLSYVPTMLIVVPLLALIPWLS
ncbi:MAG: hypothetical protein O7D31_12985, partial [Alphaproteobacteria bacterium]|nr:hypothetical protein [Alphaproteobacteria bacterium]